jgi:membrane-bound lytic murein transglycosylase D
MRPLLFIFISFIGWNVLQAADIYETRLRELSKKGLPFFYNEQVKAEIDYWLLNEEAYTSFLLGKSESTLTYVDEALDAAGLPGFLRYVPIANTNLAYDFSGKDGASGAWPMSFAIAKRYNLKVNSYTDERRSREKAAKAAASYFADLYNIYRDWNLAITAFRIGPVELNKAIRLAGNQLQYDSIHLVLPEEFQAPLVRFMGVLYIWNFHSLHNIQLKPYMPEATDTFWSACAMPFPAISKRFGVPMEDLRFFNPVLRGEQLPYVVEPTAIYLPAGKCRAFPAFRDSFCTSQHIAAPVVRRVIPDTGWHNRDSLTSIAVEQPIEQESVTILYDTLIRVVDSVTYIRIVPRAPVASTNPAPQKVWVYYTVKKGDALYTVSDVFDCTVANAKRWNKLSSNYIAPGRKMKFYVNANRLTYYKNINALSLMQKRNIAAKD